MLTAAIVRASHSPKRSRARACLCHVFCTHVASNEAPVPTAAHNLINVATLRWFGYRELSCCLGLDVVGDVEEVGKGVAIVSTGDRV